MELAPVPHRSPTRGERRRLLFGLLVTAPVIALVVLPAVLGLDRSVTTDSAMDGALSRGSVVLSRDVPTADLRAGDVITFTAPAGPERGEQVTRRLISVEDDLATTRGDALTGTDPWLLRLDDSRYARVWASIPWIGYPFVVGGGWLLLVLATIAALVVASIAGRSHRAEARRPAPAAARPPRLPVA